MRVLKNGVGVVFPLGAALCAVLLSLESDGENRHRPPATPPDQTQTDYALSDDSWHNQPAQFARVFIPDGSDMYADLGYLPLDDSRGDTSDTAGMLTVPEREFGIGPFGSAALNWEELRSLPVSLPEVERGPFAVPASDHTFDSPVRLSHRLVAIAHVDLAVSSVGHVVVLVHATGEAPLAGAAQSHVVYGISQSSDAFSGNRHEGLLPSEALDGLYRSDFSCTAVYTDVTPGDHRYYFLGQQTVGDGIVVLRDLTISALHFPLDD